MNNNKQEKNSILIKPFSKMHKGALLYYILAFVVLFFNIFVLETDNLYRTGYQTFAAGYGWIYYAANVIGLLTVISPLLHFLEGLATKVISVINLTVASLVLFQSIPDAVKPTGSIVSIIGEGQLGTGFWLILGLHALAVLFFWFAFIRRISKKKKNRQKEKELKTQRKETVEMDDKNYE